mmetsp:Transcript_24287/g.34812  ORF Transcript_24287/g.34812 Transcript_24287/m.34812 type:complete len:264 (-) Transcript_24287:4728-5519(-)
MLATEDLNRLIKQIHRDNQGAGLLIPFMSQQYIHALHFWINRQYILGRHYPLETFGVVQAMYWSERMKAETVAATDIIKAPEHFKKDTKWKSWMESVTTYLHSKTGQAGVPLAAILRDHDLPISGTMYATAHDELVDASILVGPEFAINNGVIYYLLHSLTLNGPAWSWVQGFQRTRNGRATWKALLGYYEGDSMQTRSKQEAYNSISAAVYAGPRRGFDITTYTTIHQQAHQDLFRFGEPVPENKKGSRLFTRYYRSPMQCY